MAGKKRKAKNARRREPGPPPPPSPTGKSDRLKTWLAWGALTGLVLAMLIMLESVKEKVLGG